MKKTIKLFLAAAMLFAFTQSADAQFRKKQNNRVPDRFHMGLRAGVTLNSLSLDNGSVDDLVFPTGGIGLDFQVAPIPLFVETGLYYQNRGWKNTNDTKDDHFANMPILVSYHLNLAPNLFLQPFTGFVGGYLTETEEFDGAVRVGVGLNFGRLYFNVGYDFGVIEHEGKYYISSGRYSYSTSTKWTNNTFFATIGFNWAGSR